MLVWAFAQSIHASVTGVLGGGGKALSRLSGDITTSGSKWETHCVGSHTCSSCSSQSSPLPISRNSGDAASRSVELLSAPWACGPPVDAPLRATLPTAPPFTNISSSSTSSPMLVQRLLPLHTPTGILHTVGYSLLQQLIPQLLLDRSLAGVRSLHPAPPATFTLSNIGVVVGGDVIPLITRLRSATVVAPPWRLHSLSFASSVNRWRTPEVTAATAGGRLSLCFSLPWMHVSALAQLPPHSPYDSPTAAGGVAESSRGACTGTSGSGHVSSVCGDVAGAPGVESCGGGGGAGRACSLSTIEGVGFAHADSSASEALCDGVLRALVSLSDDVCSSV